MNDIKLAYGIRDGHIVHISELKQDEKGEKCKCVCPLCNNILIAKLKDDKMRKHFAHKAQSNCDISHAQQTGLHLLAKEILRENNEIFVPGYSILRKDIYPNHTDIFIADNVSINLPNYHAIKLIYDSITIEEKIDDIIADAVIINNNRSCIVEVAVTHFVDEIKNEKLKAIGHPAFEIDLSEILKQHLTRDEIADAVLNNIDNRQWIFNPKKETELKQKKEEFKKKYEDEVKKQEERREEEKRKWKEEKKQQNIHVLQKLMIPENYANELNRLRNDKKATFFWEKYFPIQETTNYPFFIDIPITGEIVFNCDRRIWQEQLFKDYIYHKFDKKILPFHIYEVQDHIAKWGYYISFNKQRMYRTKLIINGKEKDVSFSYDVIQRYFEYLELLGFVSKISNEWFSDKPATIDPPNKHAAKILNEILNSVDLYSPDINDIIKNELLTKLPEQDKKLIEKWK